MERRSLKPLIEALIFTADRPLSIDRIMSILERESREEVRGAVRELMEEYDDGGRGLIISLVAGGYQMRTKPEFSPWLRKLTNVRLSRLSRAAMETLAIVAYRQPVTRGELEGIRGVDSGGVLRTLLDKRLVKVVGKKDIPGKPSVYGTTREFLELFDLKDLSSLPKLQEIEEVEEDAVGEVAEGYRQGGDGIEEGGGGVDPAGEGDGERGNGDPAGGEG
ncbi:MAG: SMC-Scp complex subunit ScpB [Thermodesulfobacteriota bacterium]